MNDLTRALVRMSRATALAGLYVFWGCALLAALFLLLTFVLALLGF